MDLYVLGSFLSFWTDPQNLISFSKAAFGLGLVIFVHELGHFLVAKACGVKCEKFYVGFDVPLQFGPIKLPASLFKKQVGETEYGIGIVPLGGYVKMLGQDDNPGAAAEENARIRIKKTNAAGEEEYELDPRSYPAKTVPQRMAIISAGVIMNLIFGVLFATVAYKFGVKYLPCVIGSTMPGDPAWTAGFQPGDRIVQLGKESEPSDSLRFRRELMQKVVETGEGNMLPIRVRRDGAESWLDVTPNSPFKKETGLPTIGVLSGSSNIIGKSELDDYSIVARSNLLDGDKIVSASADGETRSISSYHDLADFLILHNDDDLELEIERTVKETEAKTLLNVTLPPQKLRTLGVEMNMGPIIGVQAGSPAEAAGIRAGDMLIAINDDEIGNPLLIDEELLTSIGQEVSIKLKRGDEEMSVTLAPRTPTQIGWPKRMGGAVSSETLGIAFYLEDSVNSVVAGGPAAEAGIEPGDQITSFMVVAADGATFTSDQSLRFALGEETKFTAENRGWGAHFLKLQELPDGIEVHVQYQRGSESKTAIMQPADSATSFYPERGIVCKQLSETRTATSWGEAFSLGVRETKEGIGHVFFTLRKIKDLYRSLGGPVSIGVIATSEASAGIPRLLIFLTLLSANLAVLNFLPIPVLDGGHMMFLLYEGIFGKPVNERVAFGLTMLGLSFILALMVFVFGMDFYRFGFKS